MPRHECNLQHQYAWAVHKMKVKKAGYLCASHTLHSSHFKAPSKCLATCGMYSPHGAAPSGLRM